MGIAYPDELLSHPVAIELKLRHRSRLHERAQIVEQILRVNVGGNEALLPQALRYLMSVTLLRNPQNPTHRCRQAIRKTCHQPEVDNTEPAVLHQLEVSRMGICMQQTDGTRSCKEESHILQGSRITLLRRQVCS